MQKHFSIFILYYYEPSMLRCHKYLSNALLQFFLQETDFTLDIYKTVFPKIAFFPCSSVKIVMNYVYISLINYPFKIGTYST